jgi:hypothetical protein
MRGTLGYVSYGNLQGGRPQAAMNLNPEKIRTNPSEQPPGQGGESTSSQSAKYLSKHFCFCCNQRLDKAKKNYAPSDN